MTSKKWWTEDLTEAAEANGWTVAADEGYAIKFVKGTRELTAVGDMLGRVREASTPRGRGPTRDTKAWCKKVLAGELPSSPKRA